MRMRKSFIACIFVFVLIPVLFSANPLLWKVEGDTPVYLFGTIHYPDPRVIKLDERVSSAFEKSDVVVLEANISPENIMSIMKYMFLPESLSLSGLLSPELYKKCEEALALSGLSIVLFESMKPWALSLMLMAPVPDSLSGSTPLDLALFNMAEEKGKELLGLETLEDQIKIFDEMTYEEQIVSLEKQLNEIEKRDDQIEKLILLYLEGDEEKLCDYINHQAVEPKDIEFIDKLLGKRNTGMANGIDKLVKDNKGKTFFVGVGAGHLGGGDGVIAQLKKKGYIINRVK